MGGAIALAQLLEACSGLATPESATLSRLPTAKSTSTAEVVNQAGTMAATQTGPEPTSTQGDTMQPTEAATATPTETTPPGTAKIAFVRTNDRITGVQRAIALLGLNPVEGKRVFVKPNFNSADPPPGSTHPDVLRTTILALQEMGAKSITIGDRSGMGNTRQVMEQLGAFKLAGELGCETVVFDELGAEGWVHFHPPGSHWKKGFYLARPCVEAEALVQLCCLKTHKFGGHFTMSLKNSVGMAAKTVPGDGHNYMTELHTSLRQRSKIAEINAAYSPALVILDGVDAFVTGGPASGKMVSPQVVLAGTDRIAIDAVGVALLRSFGTTRQVQKGPVFEQEQIQRAAALGLGVDSPEKIELVTDDPESASYAEEIRAILINSR